jgi:hypothetical protein
MHARIWSGDGPSSRFADFAARYHGLCRGAITRVGLFCLTLGDLPYLARGSQVSACSCLLPFYRACPRPVPFSTPFSAGAPTLAYRMPSDRRLCPLSTVSKIIPGDREHCPGGGGGALGEQLSATLG